MALLDELVAAGERNADTIERLPEPGARAGSLAWTRAQLAAHLAAGSEEYLAMASRRRTVLTAVDDRVAVNALVIEREAATPLAELADRLRTVTHRFAEFVEQHGDEPAGWYEHKVHPNVVAGLYLADMLVHSYDLGAADIPESAAAEACVAAPHVLPFVLKHSGRPRRATISLQPRGGEATIVSIDGATATVGHHEVKVDARVVADPVTLLLTAYGRLSPVQSMRRGLRVSGPRLWRVRALQTRFETP
jgi:uncharacterized protein (TIGR03083 family)